MAETHEQAYPPVSPYLMVSRAAEAIAWYGRAYEAVEVEHYDHEGRVGHSTLRINGGVVMLSDEFPEYQDKVGTRSPDSLGGTTTTVNLVVDDVDRWFSRAVEAGATALREPQDEFYGRQCKVRDPFGHVWSFIGPVKG
jgi:PhnB protein